jgi:four helix bundle protein
MGTWSHFDLKIWKEAHALAVKIYVLSDAFPSSEKFGLTAQMRRAAHSVSATIVEGVGRHTTKDFINFLFMARGSAHEMMAHLLLAKDVRYIDSKDADALIERYRGLSAGIFACAESLKRKSSR